MPVMNGYDAATKIRRMDDPQKADIPIIAMTANAFREDAERCMEAGMNAHLAKPLDDEKIKQTISEELRSSQKNTRKGKRKNTGFSKASS